MKKFLLNAFLKVMYEGKKRDLSKNSQSYLEKQHKDFAMCRAITFQLVPAGIAILLGIWGAVSNLKLWEIVTLTVICVIYIAFTIINIWNEIIKNGFADELYEARKKEILFNEVKNSMNSIGFYVYKNAVWSSQTVPIMATITDFLKNSQEDMSAQFEEFMAQRIYQIHDILEYTNEVGEMASIAFYVYDDERKELRDYKSKKSRLMGKEKKGRSWSVNSESHLSHTFRSGDWHAFYNIRDFLPGLSEKDGAKEDDKYFYVASITYPIKYPHEDKVRGVFCITSNFAGAFSPDDLEENECKNQLLAMKKNYILSIGFMLELLINNVYPTGNEELINQINAIEN